MHSVIVALMTFFHTSIIKWLTPAANKFRALKGGWAIPIAIIFALVRFRLLSTRTSPTLQS